MLPGFVHEWVSDGRVVPTPGGSTAPQNVDAGQIALSFNFAGSRFKLVLNKISPELKQVSQDLNSKFGIGINIFQTLLLSAIKFYTHVSMLPPKQRAASNPPFFLKIIDSCSNYLFALASAKCAAKVQTKCILFFNNYWLTFFFRVVCHLVALW